MGHFVLGLHESDILGGGMVGNLLVWVQKQELGPPCLAIDIAQQFLEMSTIECLLTVHIGIAELVDQC